MLAIHLRSLPWGDPEVGTQETNPVLSRNLLQIHFGTTEKAMVETCQLLKERQCLIDKEMKARRIRNLRISFIKLNIGVVDSNIAFPLWE